MMRIELTQGTSRLPIKQRSYIPLWTRSLQALAWWLDTVDHRVDEGLGDPKALQQRSSLVCVFCRRIHLRPAGSELHARLALLWAAHVQFPRALRTRHVPNCRARTPSMQPYPVAPRALSC